MAKTNVKVELYYGAAWHDITATDDVLTRDPIRITRAGRGPGAKRPPSTALSTSLDNRDGMFSPRNPMSPLYKLIGRNTPIRVSANGGYRFHGEVSSWPQEWTTDGKNVWVPIEAAGIMLRLTAPGTTQRVLSAITSSILSVAITAPLAYYPLNDGKDSTSFSNLVDPTVTGTAVTPCKPAEGGSLVQDVTLLGFTPDQSNSNNAFSLPLTNVLLPISTHTPTGTYTITFWHRFVLPHPLDGPTRNYHEHINPALTISPSQPATLQDQTSVFHRVDFVGGTVAHVDFRMQESAETITTDHVYLNVRDSSHTYIGGPNGAVTGLSDGKWHEIQATLVQSGGNIISNLYVDGVQIGAANNTFAASMGTATFFGAGAYGGVIHPWIPAFQDETWAAYGLAHVSVHTSLPGRFYAAANGYAGETAGRRIERLCLERGVTFTGTGNLDDTTRMGAQRLLTFVDALYDAADVDMGFLYEARTFLGLAYRTRKNLYNADPALTLNYAAGGEVAPPLKPVEDWDAVANEVTVTRHGGGRATAVQLTGRLNVQEPTADPDGVGRYRKEAQVALYADGQVLNHAAWIRHLGTWDEARYPVVNMDLTAMTEAGKTFTVYSAHQLTIGDRFAITNPPAWIPPDDIIQHAQGFTEVLESHRWSIAANATPGLPYEVLAIGSTVRNRGRIPAGVSTLAGAHNTSVTSLSVTSAVKWIDSAGYAAQFPFDIIIGGERMTVTSIANYLNANPYLEANANDWTGSGASLARSTAFAHEGVASLLITPDGVSASGGATAGRVAVTAGTSYVASCWVYSPGGWSDLRPAVDWYTAVSGGAFLSTSLGVATSVPAGVWTLLTATYTAPASALGGAMRARHGGTPAAGNIWYADEIMIADPTRQVFTVLRSVNGVVKSHASGAPVQLFIPPVIAR